MKSIILVALALVAVAAAAPASPTDVALVKTLRSTFEQQPNGKYAFGYETEDGSQREETGELKEALDEENKPHTVIVVRGFFSYPKGDGKTETVNYYADETGFHADGESIPKSTTR